jgi:hypothetical protein
MGKHQLAKLHKQKPHVINLKPMVVQQQIPRDYSNHLLIGGSLCSLGVAFFGWKIKESDARIDLLRIGTDKDVRFKESEDSKIIRLAEIRETRQTALDLQTRQHNHDIIMAQKALDAKRSIGSQIESTNDEVRTQVVRQGVSKIINHYFNSGKPPSPPLPPSSPSAHSLFDYPSGEVRITWFLVISLLTYWEFVWMYFLFLFRGKG